jgi:hypothetical protein
MTKPQFPDIFPEIALEVSQARIGVRRATGPKKHHRGLARLVRAGGNAKAGA